MGDSIDLSQGPMMSSTSLIGRYSVSAVSLYFYILNDNPFHAEFRTFNPFYEIYLILDRSAKGDHKSPF
jgi:hypothetical protein